MVFAERLRIADLELRRIWEAGFRSAERWAKHPPLSPEEWVRIRTEGESAYAAGAEQSENPYPADTEAHTIWDTAWIDGWMNENDKWKVLGTPRTVIVLSGNSTNSQICHNKLRKITA